MNGFGVFLKRVHVWCRVAVSLTRSLTAASAFWRSRKRSIDASNTEKSSVDALMRRW